MRESGSSAPQLHDSATPASLRTATVAGMSGAPQANASADLDRREPSGRRLRWAGVSLVLVSLPFLLVEWVPSTDLAQHVSQLRLLGEALGGDDTYLVQWTTPYAALYVILGLPWLVLPPLAAAKCGALLVALLWVAAVHRLAAIFESPPALAVVASLLVFNHALYWGFLNFLLGFVSFVAFVEVCQRWLRPVVSERSRRGLVWLLVASLLVYWTHALWYAVSLLWITGLALRELFQQRSRDTLYGVMLAAGCFLPSFLLAASGFLRLSTSSFSTPAVYAEAVWLRWQPSLLVDAVFGGLRGPLEPVTFWLLGGVVAFFLVVRVCSRDEGGAPWRIELLMLAGLMLALYAVLPSKYTNTIFFHDRWMPVGVVALLLAPRGAWLWTSWTPRVAAVALALFVAFSTSAWTRANRTELTGLEASLRAVEPGASVLGLDYIQDRSAVYKGTPYLQMFAFAQAMHGSRLNFTFAYFAPSLVVFAQPRITWTQGLEWLPDRVRRSDFAQFDFVLASGGPDVHERFEQERLLRAITQGGVWRLYRVALPDRGETPATLP